MVPEFDTNNQHSWFSVNAILPRVHVELKGLKGYEGATFPSLHHKTPNESRPKAQEMTTSRESENVGLEYSSSVS